MNGAEGPDDEGASSDGEEGDAVSAAAIVRVVSESTGCGVVESLPMTKPGMLRLPVNVASIGIIHLPLDRPWRSQKASPPRPFSPAMVSLVALERR